MIIVEKRSSSKPHLVAVHRIVIFPKVTVLVEGAIGAEGIGKRTYVRNRTGVDVALR